MGNVKLFAAIIFLVLMQACGGGGYPGGGSGSPSTGTSSGTPSTGGSTGTSSGTPIPPPPPPPVVVTPSTGGTGSTVLQAGTLTAGDYDDQLNPTIYNQFFSDFLKTNTTTESYVDLQRRIAIKVSDSSGSPFSGAKISVKDGVLVLQQLISPANGIVYLYETLDKLPSSFDLVVSDRNGQAVTSQKIELAQLNPMRSVEVQLSALNQPSTSLDLLLTIDTTGSMTDELNYLKAELAAIVDTVGRNNPTLDIKVGLMVYRDIGDEYVTRSFPFTDIMSIQKSLAAQYAAGGGDTPEAMDQAMTKAMAFNWREQSTKILLLVADAPPHNFYIHSTWMTALAARAKQIHIVPVAASGTDDTTELLMRSMAAVTHSRYIFLTDDSGVGNSHLEPSIDCYVVTRLDNLIGRVIGSLLTGERVEPTASEIIRTKGKSINGVCQPSDAQ